MKYMKSITLAASLFMAFSLTSCDSNTPLLETITVSDDDISSALDSTQTGDFITFSSNTGAQNVDSLSFTNSIANLGGSGVFYQYSRITDRSFTLELNANIDNEQRLNNIVANLLGSNSALATEFRSIIGNRSSPDFTDDEITRLIAILNPSGAALIGDSVDELFTFDQNLYTHIVTSTNRDRFLGTLGGVYTLDTTARKIEFRLPTAVELNNSRLLPANSQIPFVSDISIFLDNIEQGTWILELNNE